MLTSQPQPVEALLHERIHHFAQAYGKFTMREKGYTTLLCARLEEKLPYKVFAPSGAMVQTIHAHLTDEQRLLASALRNGNDIYPDILLTREPLTNLDGGNLRRLEALAPLGIDALLELKFHNSFTSMTRQHVHDDLIKLEVLGHFMKALTGTRPALHFYYFNFPHPEVGIKRPELVRRWIQQVEEKTPNVNASIITQDGQIEKVTTAPGT